MIVSADAQRAALAAQALARAAAWLRVEHAGDTLEALRRSMIPGLRLVVLDWQIEGSGGCALVRHVRRMGLGVEILAFDSGASESIGLPLRLHDWSQLDAAIESAAARLREPSGDPADRP